MDKGEERMDRGENLENLEFVSKGRYLEFFFIWKKRKSSDSQLNFDTRKRGYVINKGREEEKKKKYKKMKRTDEGDDGRVHVSPRWKLL